ncbi:MAG: hypothetical protein JSV00_02405 [bacterium]|nr:MAG: hypothetical protein JSV00_02405 [bacterium]
MDAGISIGSGGLRFRLSRRDLYDIIRVNAASRPFRKVAMPALAGFVFLGHAVDGNYLKGALWAGGVAAIFWGVSQLMYLLYAYGGANETLLAPQEIELRDGTMIVTSEHSREQFPRPEPEAVKVSGGFLVVSRGERDRLVFTRRSFEREEDFQALKGWMVGGSGA